MADSTGLFIVLIIFCILSIITSTLFTYTCTDGTWDFDNFEGGKCIKWPEEDKPDPGCSTFTTQSDCSSSRCSWNTTTSSCGEPSPPSGPSTSSNFADALADVLPDEEVVAYSAGLNPACGPISETAGRGLRNICNIRTSEFECESEEVSESIYTRRPGTAIDNYYSFKEVCKWDKDKQQLIKDAEAQATADTVGAVACSSKGTPVSTIPNELEITVPSGYTAKLDNISPSYLQTRLWKDNANDPPINVKFLLLGGTYENGFVGDGKTAQFYIEQNAKIQENSEVFTIGDQSIMAYSFTTTDDELITVSIKDWLCI
jgi:hypothetical protein